MIQSYLLQYGFLLALALLFASAIYMIRAQYKVPGLLVAISSFVMFTLKVMHEITFSQELVSYTHDEQGQVLGANIEFTIWQSASLWAEPIGLIVVACGILVLSLHLQALNKRM